MEYTGRHENGFTTAVARGAPASLSRPSRAWYQPHGFKAALQPTFKNNLFCLKKIKSVLSENARLSAYYFRRGDLTCAWLKRGFKPVRLI
jgi:hypothetical protein